MQTPTALWHFHGLPSSARRRVPSVGRPLMRFGRLGCCSDGCWLEMARMGMESQRRVPDHITPSWISLSWGGFAKRTDWRSHCEATYGFLPSSTPSSMPKPNWSSSTIVQTPEERGRRRCRRGLRFFFGGWDTGSCQE